MFKLNFKKDKKWKVYYRNSDMKLRVATIVVPKGGNINAEIRRVFRKIEVIDMIMV